MPRTGTRPTTDRVRESLFNLLTARIDFAGLSVLDLYAGSGALGLEALSRGATSVLFVESDDRAAAVIAKNIAALGATGATLRRGAVAAVLAGGTDRPMDLVLGRPALRGHRCGDRGDACCAGCLRVDGGRQRRRRRARAASGPALSWPGGWQTWQDRALRRHSTGAGRADLNCPDSVIDHERRGMPGILRPGDFGPCRHLRTRRRPIRRSGRRSAGQPEQEGDVQPRGAHRDDRGVARQTCRICVSNRGRGWWSTS